MYEWLSGKIELALTDSHMRNWRLNSLTWLLTVHPYLPNASDDNSDDNDDDQNPDHRESKGLGADNSDHSSDSDDSGNGSEGNRPKIGPATDPQQSCEPPKDDRSEKLVI